MIYIIYIIYSQDDVSGRRLAVGAERRAGGVAAGGAAVGGEWRGGRRRVARRSAPGGGRVRERVVVRAPGRQRGSAVRGSAGCVGASSLVRAGRQRGQRVYQRRSLVRLG